MLSPASSRFLNVDVSLAGAELSSPKVRRFVLVDRLHTIPELTVEIVCDDPALLPRKLLGQRTTVRLDEAMIPRFDGIVRSVEQIAAQDGEGGASIYRVVIVPELWLATERTDCRTFQNRTSIEILQAMFGATGAYRGAAPPPQGGVFNELAAREYRVQYHETDADFAFRALSEDGIVAFWAPDGEGKRDWVLTDDTTVGTPEMDLVYRPLSGALASVASVASVAPASSKHGAKAPAVLALSSAARVCAAAVRLRDYDAQKPQFALERTCLDGDAPRIEDGLVRYSFAVGQFDTEGEGDDLAQKRLEATRSGHHTFTWETNVALRPGAQVRLSDHPCEEANGVFLVVSARSEIAPQSAKHVAEVVPAAVPWRPEVRPKPRIWGTQTATVVDASGSGDQAREIDVDREGRVAVAFRWDTAKPRGFRRVRVSQGWAGAVRGFWMTPRVGDEVVIAYLDGDPDEPLIVGRVHNALTPPPGAMPAEQTRSIWRSRSTPGGEGYNEIFMEDKKGEEVLSLRAERDFTSLTNRNSDTTVGHHQTVKVKGSQDVSVGGGQALSVGGSGKTMVGGDSTLSAKNVYLIATAGDAQGGYILLSSSADIQLNAVGKRQDFSGTKHEIHSKEVEVKADKITLNAGGSVIEMAKAGIKIASAGPVEVVGSVVKLNC